MCRGTCERGAAFRLPSRDSSRRLLCAGPTRLDTSVDPAGTSACATQNRVILLLLFAVVAAAQSPKYGVGRSPSAEEVQRWDISVRPDGKGLPAGSGTVAEGKEIYTNRCLKCHGAAGQGRDSVALVGGRGTLNTANAVKTVESYWPYATTVFDYVSRAMPFDNPGTLTPNQVYAVTAYVLNLAHIVPDNAVLDAASLPKIRMPNRDGFVPDPRPDVGKASVKMKP